MGDALIKRAVFPVIGEPEAEEKTQWSKNIVWDERPEGTPLSGVRRPFLWLPIPSGTKTTLIYFHANGEDLSFVERHLRKLGNYLRVNVLAVEYPGYGPLRGGKVHEASCAEIIGGIDSAGVHALWYAVSELGCPPNQVVIHGHSLGSGAALRLALHARNHMQLGGVIVQSPFMSLKKAAADIFGGLGSMVMPDHYDNLDAIRQLYSDPSGQKVPLMVVHGEKDTVIPPYHGHELHDEAIRLGALSVCGWFPENATHNDWDAKDLAGPISEFLKANNITVQGGMFDSGVALNLGSGLSMWACRGRGCGQGRGGRQSGI